MRSFTASRFFDVPRTTCATSEGPVTLPILYYDVRNVVGLFAVPIAKARDVLAGTGLEPVTAGRKRAVVGLSFYEYRRTTVGVYNEVGTAIFCVREGEPTTSIAFADVLRSPAARALGVYVVDLPVTTAVAHAAGREIWGYPKFVTPISFRLEGREVDLGVEDPGGAGDICRLRGRLGRGVPAPPLSLVTYTHLHGVLLRTHIDVRGAVRVRASGSVRLHVGGSKHVMADRLRALGLEDARPFLTMVTDRFQSILHAGVRVG